MRRNTVHYNSGLAFFSLLFSPQCAGACVCVWPGYCLLSAACPELWPRGQGLWLVSDTYTGFWLAVTHQSLFCPPGHFTNTNTHSLNNPPSDVSFIHVVSYHHVNRASSISGHRMTLKIRWGFETMTELLLLSMDLWHQPIRASQTISPSRTLR